MLTHWKSIVFAVALISAISAEILPQKISAQGFNPFVQKTTVEELAEKIDELEEHIEKYGSIVTKKPDVWGEARLTQHRAEYEKILEEKKDDFSVVLGAAISRRDAAFFAQSFAVQSTVQSQQDSGEENSRFTSNTSVQLTPDINAKDSEGPKNVLPREGFDDKLLNAALGVKDDGSESPAKIAIEPTLMLNQLSRYMNHLQELRRINVGDDTSDSPGYAIQLVRFPVSVLPGKKTREGYGAQITVSIEPKLSEELLPNMFRDLVINDVVDIVSLPVTRIINNADMKKLEEEWNSYIEIRELEKVSLLSLIKLMNSNSITIAKFKDDKYKPLLEDKGIRFNKAKNEFEVITFDGLNPEEIKKLISQLKDMPNKYFKEWISVVENYIKQEPVKVSGNQRYRVNFEKMPPSGPSRIINLQSVPGLSDKAQGDTLPTPENLVDNYIFQYSLANTSDEEINTISDSQDSFLQYLDKQQKQTSLTPQSGTDIEFENMKDILIDALGTGLSTINQRRAKQPVPPTFQRNFIGKDIIQVAIDAYHTLNDPRLDQSNQDYQYPDVKGFIRSEAEAAYEFLSKEQESNLWKHCGVELADAIHENRRDLDDLFKKTLILNNTDIQHRLEDPTRWKVYRRRAIFHSDVRKFHPELTNSTTAAMSWVILAESAILNERLVKDMKDIAAAKNCDCMPTGWHQFYGPNPSPDARYAFNEYVRCRWPIHVFAIDPVTQDQNVADSFSRRREAQFAASVALANGSVSPQSFTRFARRIEMDMATIDLNRPVVGFSHGENTFGWRFYPRVQSPEIDSNLKVFVQDLLIGGPRRDHDIRDRRLEPGPRECTAIVVMPSFVPYVMVDTRTSWFKLTNSKSQKMNLEDAMELSREVTELRTMKQACMEDQHLYRNGDVHRLFQSVEQLEKRLPLQTAYVQVPYENTLGGFEMFDSSRNSLIPRLEGWYGEPGIRHLAVTPEQTGELDKARVLEMRMISLLADLTRAKSENNTAQVTALETAITDHEKNLAKARTALRNIISNPGSTSLFLVGNNFSILETKIIAGGIDVSETIEIMSREVLKVQIPPQVTTIKGKDKDELFVDVHLATAYGPSGNLLIPVVETKISNQLNEIEAKVKNITESVKKLTDSHTEFEFVKLKTPLQISAKVDKKSDCEDICLKKCSPWENRIQIKGNPAVRFGDDVQVAQLAFFVNLKMQKGDPKRVKIKPFVEDVTFGYVPDEKEKEDVWIGTGELKTEDLISKINKGLNELLREVPYDTVGDEIELIGYLKFNDAQLPITKINNPIKIKIKKLKSDKEVELTSATAAPKAEGAAPKSPIESLPPLEKLQE